jgi:hypothetical protein
VPVAKGRIPSPGGLAANDAIRRDADTHEGQRRQLDHLLLEQRSSSGPACPPIHRIRYGISGLERID